MPPISHSRQLSSGALFSHACTILTVFLRPANGVHVLHDGDTVLGVRRHPRLAKDARGFEANVLVVDGDVHFPGQVVRWNELVGGIAHGWLVPPAMTRTNCACPAHDLE